MRKSMTIVFLAAAAMCTSTGVLARGGGGSNGFSHGSAGGPPLSSRADENSNGRFSTDRDKGLDRAADRRSEEGTEHEKATDARKRKTKAPARDK